MAADKFDFICFFIDRKSFKDENSEFPTIGDYHVPVFSDIKGINYEAEGNPGSYMETTAWESRNLRACFVRSLQGYDSIYRFLHELGHYWSAYTTFKTVDGQSTNFDLLACNDPSKEYTNDFFHWGSQFMYNSSPMEYGLVKWIEKGNNIFEKTSISDIENSFSYCPIELYLMGLLPADKVGRIRILKDLKPTPNGEPNLFTATPVDITIEDIIRSCGPRVPHISESPTNFKVAIVVLSKNETKGESFAQNREVFRTKYEAQFNFATTRLATLDTSVFS